MSSGWINNKAPEKRNRSRVAVAMKRVPGEMRLHFSGKIIKVRVFLHDISSKGVGLFVETKVEVGATVDLVIEMEKSVFVKGKVVWCAESGATSNVISSENFKYRAGLDFYFENPETEKEFRDFCSYVTTLAK